MASSIIISDSKHHGERIFSRGVRLSSGLRYPWLRTIEALLDGLTVFASLIIGFRVAALVTPADSFFSSVHHLQLAILGFSIIMVLLLDRGGAYRASGGLLRIRETACVIESVFVGTLILTPALLLPHPLGTARIVFVQACLLGALLIVQKQLIASVFHQLHRKGAHLHRVLIYGTPASAETLCLALERSPKLGLLPVALVCKSHATPQRSERSSLHLPVHPCAAFNSAMVENLRVDTVIVASPIASQAALQEVIAHSRAASARVIFGAEAYAMGPSEIDTIELDGQMVYGVHEVRTHFLREVTSRALDIFGSGLILLLAVVPMALAAWAVYLETGGPILFKQKRIGMGGKPFTIYKFRTMYTHACGDNASPTDGGAPRITRVGRWLRRTSLDELPQLFNILRGDMALVGPRPEMPFIVANYSEQERKRLEVKPGLTGIWQISADRRYPIHENLHYDLYYLKHRSIVMDIALIFHTLLFAVHGT
jgi:exopolysaccharide biosynthesis polyprenyl glycosylphosphotransferase